VRIVGAIETLTTHPKMFIWETLGL